MGASLWFVLMCFVLAVGIWSGHCSLTHFSKQIIMVPLIAFGPFVIALNTCSVKAKLIQFRKNEPNLKNETVFLH